MHADAEHRREFWSYAPTETVGSREDRQGRFANRPYGYNVCMFDRVSLIKIGKSIPEGAPGS